MSDTTQTKIGKDVGRHGWSTRPACQPVCLFIHTIPLLSRDLRMWDGLRRARQEARAIRDATCPRPVIRSQPHFASRDDRLRGVRGVFLDETSEKRKLMLLLSLIMAARPACREASCTFACMSAWLGDACVVNKKRAGLVHTEYVVGSPTRRRRAEHMCGVYRACAFLLGGPSQGCRGGRPAGACLVSQRVGPLHWAAV